MGNAVIPFTRKKVAPLTVDPPHKDSHKDFTFAPNIFKRFEWEALKAFSAKYEIRQANLVIVFKKYLTHDEVYVRQFRARTVDIRNRFIHLSKLMQELTDVFVPTIFLKNFPGLEPMEDLEEITFARLIINSYFFCRQSLPDLFCEFFALLRRNPNLPLSAKIGLVSVRQVGVLLLEDMQRCGTKTYLLRALQSLPEGDDTNLEGIIRLGVKYPLLFFALVRFRHHTQRQLLGDAFWAQPKHRQPLRLQCLDWRSEEEAALVADHQVWFANETAARAQTAHAILCDLCATGVAYAMRDTYYSPLPVITPAIATVAKECVGYSLARQLLLESNAALPAEPLVFLQPCTSSNTSSTALPLSIAAVAGPYALHELSDALCALAPPDRLPLRNASPRNSPNYPNPNSRNSSPKRSLSPTKPSSALPLPLLPLPLLPLPLLPLPSLQLPLPLLPLPLLPSMQSAPLTDFTITMPDTIGTSGNNDTMMAMTMLEDADTIPLHPTNNTNDNNNNNDTNNDNDTKKKEKKKRKKKKKLQVEDDDEDEITGNQQQQTKEKEIVADPMVVVVEEVTGQREGEGNNNNHDDDNDNHESDDHADEEEEEECEEDEDEDGDEDYYEDFLPPLTARHEGNLQAVLSVEDNILVPVRDQTATSQRDFVYSTLTGRTRWVMLFADDQGHTLQRSVGY